MTDKVREEELEELRREMRQTAWMAWARQHAQQLAAGVVALVLALVGIGLWIERGKVARKNAAIAYQQAINTQDLNQRIERLQAVASTHADTAYAAMAHWLLASLEENKAEEHLRQVIAHPEAADEWRWQARLDLAARLLAEGKKEKAKALLAEPVGAHYQQLAHYLRAVAESDTQKRRAWLEKALKAPSHDEKLKAHIQQMLASMAR